MVNGHSRDPLAVIQAQRPRLSAAEEPACPCPPRPPSDLGGDAVSPQGPGGLPGPSQASLERQGLADTPFSAGLYPGQGVFFLSCICNTHPSQFRVGFFSYFCLELASGNGLTFS